MNRLFVRNGEPFPRNRVPVLGAAEARRRALDGRERGDRLLAMFLAPPLCHLLLAQDEEGVVELFAFEAGSSFPSLTPDWTQAHLFEREIAEQHGATPEGHPWLKPVRGLPPLDAGAPDLFRPPEGAKCRLDAYPFLRAEGEEMHEVGVGPVHAGTIEPGHFRFLCHGEEVHHLEISLGYQARGIERRLLGGPGRGSLALLESVAGDTAVGHAVCYARAVDTLGGTRVSARAATLRVIALELERCANHIGDLGALGNDVGFLPAAAWYGALRGDFLNLLMDLSGNRYGRGLVRPGGVAFDLDRPMAADFAARIRRAAEEFDRISGVLFRTPSVNARFEGTGRLAPDVASDLGMVGPAARASGLDRDARRDFAHGAYRFLHIPVAVAASGDVAARALVRRLETERSLQFLKESVSNLPDGAPSVPVRPPAPGTGSVSITEGWRGEIVHVALTDERGRFERYKIVDPSFRNWSGLAMALRGEEISDFPLCNKSFNLSYAGHDL